MIAISSFFPSNSRGGSIRTLRHVQIKHSIKASRPVEQRGAKNARVIKRTRNRERVNRESNLCAIRAGTFAVRTWSLRIAARSTFYRHVVWRDFSGASLVSTIRNRYIAAAATAASNSRGDPMHSGAFTWHTKTTKCARSPSIRTRAETRAESDNPPTNRA